MKEIVSFRFVAQVKFVQCHLSKFMNERKWICYAAKLWICILRDAQNEFGARDVPFERGPQVILNELDDNIFSIFQSGSMNLPY